MVLTTYNTDTVAIT